MVASREAKKSSRTESPIAAFRTRVSDRLFKQTSMYGFELFMAAIGILAAIFVIDYGVAMFFNHLYELLNDGNNYTSYNLSAPLWLVAAMLVGVPVALTFYIRVKSEAQRLPRKTTSRTHKIIVSLYLFATIATAVLAVIFALYYAIQILVGVSQDAIELLVRLIIPLLLIAAIHVGGMFAFSNSPLAGKKKFAISFAALTFIVMSAVLMISVGEIRSTYHDENRQEDLQTLTRSINRYYANNRQLPQSISDTEIVSNESLNFSIDDYSYIRGLSNRYEMCADFERDTRNNNPSYYEERPDNYSAYETFAEHNKGRACFKLSARANTYNW